MTLHWHAAMISMFCLSFGVIGQTHGAPAKVDGSKPSPAQYLHLETEQGDIECQLTGEGKTIKQLEKYVREHAYTGTTVCRAVNGYFVQLGCRSRLHDMGEALASEQRVRLPSTGTHDTPGTLAFARYGNGEVGMQLVLTTIRSPWLDGTQPVLGRCKPVRLIQELSAQPTLAQAVPRRPTLILSATIGGPDSTSSRNGLAK
jgi:cyclophilin family peptidyl-prolyl cis-trans isomerase